MRDEDSVLDKDSGRISRNFSKNSSEFGVLGMECRI